MACEGEGFEVVIITSGNFRHHIDPLRAWREGQGWSVAVVDVEDLYDEWSFGAKSSWAVRGLPQPCQCPVAATAALCAAGGRRESFDPRNYLERGEFDLVPTKLVDTTFLETASDGWFADFDGDGIPEMAIGRLPVDTGEEVNTVVQKLVGYEQQGSARWAAVMVADDQDGFDFEEAVGGGNSPARRDDSLGDLQRSGW